MDIEYFHEFETTARLLNYRRAAETLHMSKSSLSKHISTLEEYLGFRLFSSDSPMTLTPAGRVFFESVAEVGSLYRSKLAKCKKMDAGFPRSYFIGLPLIQDEAVNIVQSALVSFSEDFQKVYSCDSASSEKVIELVVKEALDIGLFYTIKEPRELKEEYCGIDLQFKLLAEEPLMVMTGQRGPVSHLKSVRIEDLKDIPILLAFMRCGVLRQTVVDSLFEHANMTPQYRAMYVDGMERLLTSDLGDTVHVVTRSITTAAAFRSLNKTANIFIPLEGGFTQKTYLVYKQSNQHAFGRMLLERIEKVIERARVSESEQPLFPHCR